MSVPKLRDSDSCPPEDEILTWAAGSTKLENRKQLLVHLDSCGTCQYLLAEAVRSLKPQTGDSRGTVQTFAPGDVAVDRYRIERFLAEGGMGEVYLAKDVLLEEWVALKTLACTALDDDRAAFRFKAEARLARRVTHPNVCRILEFGVHVRTRGRHQGESIPIMTMEFLPGETLARRMVRRGRLSPDAIARVLQGVFAGLEAIHAAGIVHRDFKSENVFLVPNPRGERVIVMDFGLARALDGSVPSTAPIRRMLLGTLDTMAPEQFDGAAPNATMDVFAMGVFLFEVLTGHRPFAGMSASERRSQRAPAPSSLLPATPPAWDQIVGRCLEQDPAARYQTVTALRKAVTDQVYQGRDFMATSRDG
jgi:serine/threonine protein kinase